MPNNQEGRFTIGQFARLHSINKKTLMWYDEVGIFQPAAVGENGYRYYTYHQSSLLETILALRELKVSIPEIGAFIQARSAAALQSLLEEKRGELEQTIAHLKAVRRDVDDQLSHLVRLQTLELSEIQVVTLPEVFLAVVELQPNASFEWEAEQVAAAVKRHGLSQFRNASYGSILPAEALAREDFDAYSALFIRVDRPGTMRGLVRRPPGRYLRAYCQGSWDKLPQAYRRVLRWAKVRGLAPAGPAYEQGINETVIDRMDEYITQIDIPVEKRSMGTEESG